jgi:hypothetical protein
VSRPRIKILIVRTRSGQWAVFVNGWRYIGQSCAEPLRRVAEKLIHNGAPTGARLTMTYTPAGPCHAVATLGAAANASRATAHFHEPEWRQTNGANGHAH